MLLSKLFERNNVECPQWLSNVYIEDNWSLSVYSFEDNVHKWYLKNPFQDVVITFDGIEYHFIAYDKYGEKLFDNIITENEHIFC